MKAGVFLVLFGAVLFSAALSELVRAPQSRSAKALYEDSLFCVTDGNSSPIVLRSELNDMNFVTRRVSVQPKAPGRSRMKVSRKSCNCLEVVPGEFELKSGKAIDLEVQMPVPRHDGEHKIKIMFEGQGSPGHIVPIEIPTIIFSDLSIEPSTINFAESKEGEIKEAEISFFSRSEAANSCNMLSVAALPEEIEVAADDIQAAHEEFSGVFLLKWKVSLTQKRNAGGSKFVTAKFGFDDFRVPLTIGLNR